MAEKPNIPRKHHYVPQIHIQKFKTNDGYHLYLKDKNTFAPATNSNSFFFKKDLNSNFDFTLNEINHHDVEISLLKNGMANLILIINYYYSGLKKVFNPVCWIQKSLSHH
jgi:hypothetical protein